jgi:lipid II:glycine glycyltransferase (peptidoglycan interpeptide bridge formation enzyme)
VDYAAAASTRPEDIRIPLAFALTWDLIRWGKRVGATWFDFGGITGVTEGQNDPLKGISDFKRNFGNNVVSVGEEWVLEPRLTSHLARAVSAAAALLRRLA